MIGHFGIFAVTVIVLAFGLGLTMELSKPLR